MENFKDLNLSPALSQAIEELGFQTPTPIQAQTLPILLEGPTDFLGLAATGTGKTAAYGIPLLEGIDPSLKQVQAVVLCPTRELAIQVTEQLNLLGKHKRVRALPIYGGAGYGDQIRGLRQGAPIVVATPGRLVDHLEKGTLTLEEVRTVVLDEADEMISMGFKEEIEGILEQMTPGAHNTWLFSATMSADVRKVAAKFLRSPQTVQVNKTEMLSGTVRQIYYPVKESDKNEVLAKIMDAADDFYGLIFCQTKSLCIDLTADFVRRGYPVDCLHGDMDQTGRERTMKKFRERKVSILFCTDVACRGLDVKELTHVINYSIPRELDNYVHRIGRTGRNGKEGLALSLVTPSHFQLLGRIERLTQTRIERGTIPTRKEVATKKLKAKLQSILQLKDFTRASELLDTEWLLALDEMPKEEIAARFLTLALPELFVDRVVQGPAVMVTTPASIGKVKHFAASGASSPVRPISPRGEITPRGDAMNRGEATVMVKPASHSKFGPRSTAPQTRRFSQYGKPPGAPFKPRREQAEGTAAPWGKPRHSQPEPYGRWKQGGEKPFKRTRPVV